MACLDLRDYYTLVVVEVVVDRVVGQVPAPEAGAEREEGVDDPQLAAQSASLLLVPVAADVPIGRALQLELYGAWARGAIERGSETLTLTGPVNANVRAVWAAA